MISFNQERPDDMDRINYALVVFNEQAPCCYSTLIEIDKNSVYMQHGGAFPNVAKSVYTVKGYHMMVNILKSQYSFISTRVLNKNYPMIKLAHSAEFLINGIDVCDDEIFLNLYWKKA